MRRAAKRDAVELAIVRALRQTGWSVQHLSGCGVPDLLVSRSPDKMLLLEIKGKGGKLTPDQVAWHAQWRGPKPVILRSVDEALALGRE